MSVQNTDGSLTVVAAVAIAAYLLVKPDGNLQNGASVTKTHAGVSDNSVGIGALCTLINPAGKVRKVVANVLITVGAAVYYDANGRVGTTAASNTQLGVALEAASGAGSVIAVAFT